MRAAECALVCGQKRIAFGARESNQEKNDEQACLDEVDVDGSIFGSGNGRGACDRRHRYRGRVCKQRSSVHQLRQPVEPVRGQRGHGSDPVRPVLAPRRHHGQPDRQGDAEAVCEPDQHLGPGECAAGDQHLERVDGDLCGDPRPGLDGCIVHAHGGRAVHRCRYHLAGAGLGDDAGEQLRDCAELDGGQYSLRFKGER